MPARRSTLFSFVISAAFAATGVSCAGTAGTKVDETGKPGGPNASGQGGGNGGGQGGGTPNFVAATGGSSGGGLEDGGSCVAESYGGEQIPLDIYIMLDSTGSMAADQVANGQTKWQAVTTALKTFLKQSPATDGVGVGIQFFPTPATPSTQSMIDQCTAQCTDCGCIQACGCSGCSCTNNVCKCTAVGGGNVSCNAADYSTAALDIAPLPAAADPIIMAIDAVMPQGNTPTTASLAGALTYTEAWATAHPNKTVVLVYATDGYPEGCGADNTIANAAQSAQTAFSGSPSIRTYVLGVGDMLNSLNAIAAAGGTQQAFIVTNQNATQDFIDAMNTIRRSALSCDFVIPQPQQGTLDYNLINVNLRVGSSGTPAVLSQVADAASCDPQAGGWHYDDPNHPSRITLCDATCNAVEMAPGSQVDVLLGCATQRAPLK